MCLKKVNLSVDMRELPEATSAKNVESGDGKFPLFFHSRRIAIPSCPPTKTWKSGHRGKKKNGKLVSPSWTSIYLFISEETCNLQLET